MGRAPPSRRCGWSAWTCAPGPSSSPSSPTSTPSASSASPWSQASAGGRWLSERELRREAGKSHVPDAAVQLPDDPDTIAGAGLYGEDVDPLPKRVAVEVELTRKGAARLREAWTRPRHGRWTRTVYYAPPEVAGYLTGQLQRIRPRHPIQVTPRPRCPAPATRAPEVPRDPSTSPCAGPRLAGHPGQPIPRAARQPAANGLLLVMLVLVWFSPLSIVAWLVGQAVILLQRRWHWWRFTLAALAWIGLVLAVTGPEEALRRHIFVPQHFWQYVALHFGFGPPGTRITVGQFLHDLVVTQVWLAVPVGLLAASCRCGMPSGRRRGRGAPSSAAASASTNAPATARPPGWSPPPRPQAHRARPGDRPGRRPGQLAAGPLRRPPPSCAARPWPWSAPPGPARPSPCCASPTWPACWVARSASPTARAPTPPSSRP